MKTLFVYMGGTMGMIPSKDGLVPSIGVVENCLQKLYDTGDVLGSYEIIAAKPLIDSSAIEPEDWNWIGSQIVDRYDDFDGFVVIHGTDTLAYSACALSFGLVGLGKPVIVTGAMLPLVMEGSDGRKNLREAAFAAAKAPAGVWVQFAGKLMHGARVRKSHSSALDAFFDAEASAPPRHLATSLRWQGYTTFNIPLLTFVPGISGQFLSQCLHDADGIILRCYGAGTMPEVPEFKETIRAARLEGKPVVATSKCADGGVALGRYASGANLLSSGIIDGKSATATAAYVKTLFVLSKGQDDASTLAELARPICGEFG